MAIKIETTDEFDGWLRALRDREARRRILVRIRRLQAGNPGEHRVLTGGVAEMKIDHGPGYRVYYVTRGNITYVLLCGGDKTTQKRDIELALEMARQV